jgi:hypothetical protein
MPLTGSQKAQDLKFMSNVGVQLQTLADLAAVL